MAADTSSGPRKTGIYRALLAVVITLGVLIVLAVAALIAGAVIRFSARERVEALPEGGGLPAGARITAVETSGNRVVIGLHTPEGDEVDIFDTDTGRFVARIRPVPPSVPK